MSEAALNEPAEDGRGPDGRPDARVVNDWIDEGDLGRLSALIEELHEADLADLIEQTDDRHRRMLVALAGDQLDAEVFVHLRAEVREALIAELEPRRVAAIIEALDSDDAVETLFNIDDDHRNAIISHLSSRMRAAVEEGLTYPEDSAGRLIQREVTAFPQFWTVGKTIDYLRAAPGDLPDDFVTIFITDPMFRVTGSVPIARILHSHRGVRLTDIADDEIPTVPVDMDQEDVAHMFRQYSLYAAPVVGEGGRLLGVITVDDIVDVIQEEAEEDILRLGGVEASDLYRDTWATARSRFSWLAVNLVTAILASLSIGLFEATLEEVVALAILMPIVASMGGNAGTQSLTVAVRALATRELTKANTARLIVKETLVGMLNGVAFAALAGVVTLLWFGDPRLGAVIAFAMVANLLVAGVAGAAIPILLQRVGVDPAVASAVFLTTVTDIVGFVAFLGLAALVLL